MATLECSAIAVPFLCQYSLSLCKGNQLFSPTRESCFKLRDFCFSDSWLVVEKQKNYGYLLPNCSTATRVEVCVNTSTLLENCLNLPHSG